MRKLWLRGLDNFPKDLDPIKMVMCAALLLSLQALPNVCTSQRPRAWPSRWTWVRTEEGEHQLPQTVLWVTHIRCVTSAPPDAHTDTQINKCNKKKLRACYKKIAWGTRGKESRTKIQIKICLGRSKAQESSFSGLNVGVASPQQPAASPEAMHPTAACSKLWTMHSTAACSKPRAKSPLQGLHAWKRSEKGNGNPPAESSQPRNACRRLAFEIKWKSLSQKTYLTQTSLKNGIINFWRCTGYINTKRRTVSGHNGTHL